MDDVDHLVKFIFLITNFDIYLQDENVNGSAIRLDLVLLLFLRDMDFNRLDRIRIMSFGVCMVYTRSHSLELVDK